MNSSRINLEKISSVDFFLNVITYVQSQTDCINKMITIVKYTECKDSFIKSDQERVLSIP